MKVTTSLALATLLYGCVLLPGPASDLPTVEVTQDDTVIAASCRVVISPETTIVDDEGDGVIHVRGSDITIEFGEASHLKGEAKSPDEYRGIGVRLVDCRNVVLRNVHVSRYWCGIWATRCDGLVLESCDGSDNRRARLGSTVAAEDGADWLSPHHNDANEWLTRYGSAFYIEDSKGITVRDCRVRQGQNALCLDNVAKSRIYDNDFSFLSGWGVALWRSSRNVISRNALDFCIRGYSHGVYNRGQDSAGILAFEQCSENLIIENSATHGGDGFFGFAGIEALGDKGKHDPEWYERRGNNDNILVRNDFSYAAAHGIEMTFSFGNQFLDNRLVENAICGVWGGYSQDTLITGNHLQGNGEMAYGLERGGINIEHGQDNHIVGNDFRSNNCGVHLWWDPDEGFAKKPWALQNGVSCSGNVIQDNSFRDDDLALHLRGPGSTIVGDNELRVVKNTKTEGGHELQRRATAIDEVPRDHVAIGKTKPVGARAHLGGRDKIIMTEWGPWDHEGPLLRLIEAGVASHVYEIRGVSGVDDVKVSGRKVQASVKEVSPEVFTCDVIGIRGGPNTYTVEARVGEGLALKQSGVIFYVDWTVTFFHWPEEKDPRKELDAWRKLAETGATVQLPDLSFRYAMGGPKDQGLGKALDELNVGVDHFGMMAWARVPIHRGRWRFKTLSDDGVRVRVDGQPVIENWTWHGPTRDAGEIVIEEDWTTVGIVVEHFEIDGYAVLELEIEPVESP